VSGYETVDFKEGAVVLIDQRLLPQEEVYLSFHSAAETAKAITDMVVRGAPAIGCTAAFGMAAEAFSLRKKGVSTDWVNALTPGAKTIRDSRPTAINLMWAVDKIMAMVPDMPDDQVPEQILEAGRVIHAEDLQACKDMGKNGAALLPGADDKSPITIMTHCNAGGLATAGYGTALGVIRAAHESGRKVKVITNETRPYNQGARLTAWEMVHAGIETYLACDNQVGHLMATGQVDAVVVGTDRVAANGDVANKIGTYTVAVLAQRHNIPFFVACPLSTIARGTPTGGDIPIEVRSDEEVTHFRGVRTAAEGVKVLNFAFDVTPADLVTALATEKGVAQPPNNANINTLFNT